MKAKTKFFIGIVVVIIIAAAITIPLVLIHKNKDKPPSGGEKPPSGGIPDKKIQDLKNYYAKLSTACLMPHDFANCAVNKLIAKYGFDETYALLHNTKPFTDKNQAEFSKLIDPCLCGHVQPSPSVNSSFDCSECGQFDCCYTNEMRNKNCMFVPCETGSLLGNVCVPRDKALKAAELCNAKKIPSKCVRLGQLCPQ